MTIFIDYQLANKNQESKFKGEELSRTAVLRDFSPVKNEIGKLKTAKRLIKYVIAEMTSNAVKKKKGQSKTCDKILEIVELCVLKLQ